MSKTPENCSFAIYDKPDRTKRVYSVHPSLEIALQHNARNPIPGTIISKFDPDMYHLRRLTNSEGRVVFVTIVNGKPNGIDYIGSKESSTIDPEQRIWID